MNDQEEILAYLKSIWPESAAMTKMVGQIRLGPLATQRAVNELVNDGRIHIKPQSYFNGYRLTPQEAAAQGIDMTPPAPSRTYDVYKLEPLKPKPMQAARQEAEQAMQVMSRRGDSLVPFMPPIHMGSNIAGGMR